MNTDAHASEQRSADPDTTEQLELQAGRRAPYTMTPDWVLLAPISRDAKVIYWALAGHVNQNRGDDDVWPTQQHLAKIVGYKKSRDVRNRINELVEINAVEVRKTRTHDGMRPRSIYTVHQTPPEQWEHPTSLKDFYQTLKEEEFSQVTSRGPTQGPSRGPTQGPEPDQEKPDEQEPDQPKAGASVAGWLEAATSTEGRNSAPPSELEQRAESLLGALVMPHGSQYEPRRAEVEHVAAALEAGASEQQVREAILSGIAGAERPAATVKHRCAGLWKLAHRGGRENGAQRACEWVRPDWCGSCEEVDRTYLDEAGQLVQCPSCHPSVVGWVERAVERVPA